MDVFPFLHISSFEISFERHRISSLNGRRACFLYWTLTSIQHYPHFIFQRFFHTIFVWIYEYEMLISFNSLFHFFEHRATQSIVSSSNLLCLPDIISFIFFLNQLFLFLSIGSDINNTDRSTTGQYLATADDFGQVKIFNFPCPKVHLICFFCFSNILS